MRSFEEIKEIVDEGKKLPSTASPEEEFAYQELKFAFIREREKVITKNVSKGMQTRARRWFNHIRELRLRYVETTKQWQDSLMRAGWMVSELLSAIKPDADPWELLRLSLKIIARYENHNEDFYAHIMDEKLNLQPPEKIIRTPVGLMPARIMEKHNEHKEKDSA
ncbi:MAG: hypothetical protein IKB88_02080 [Clostridia bacterium]|nr:hypothetical protein [Clostridia bacterium]